MSYGISSLFGGGYSYNNSLFGINSMYGLLSDYNQVRSSGFRNIINAYYNLENDTTVTDTTNKTDNKTSKTNKVSAAQEKANNNYKEVKSDADALYSSAKKLYTTGDDSIFKKVEKEVTDSETGEKTKVTDYDKDKIVSAIKNFVSDYNNLLSSVDNANSSILSSKIKGLTDRADNLEEGLNEIGITIGKNGTLSVDEEKLKNADFDKVKELFSGTSSLAWKAGQDSFATGIAAYSLASLSGTDYYRSWNA